MPVSVAIPKIDAVLLNRLLRKESIATAVYWTRIALLVASGILIILIFSSLISSLLDISTTVEKANNTLEKQLAQSTLTASDSTEAGDYNYLKKKGPFGDIGAKTGPALPEKKEEKITDMKLALIGTFITGGLDPYAIIEDLKSKDQEVFNINDSVFEQATLVAIFTNKVELRRNGQIEVLKIDDSASSSDDSSGAASDMVTVNESELTEALDNLPLLLTQARAVPYFKDGQAIGLRLFAIKTGSLYEKIGLKNGDILKSINGNSLGDITQAVKLFEKLRVERSISLVLERNRQEQTIRYEIR